MSASADPRLYSELGPYAIVPEWVLDVEVSDRAVRLYALLARYAGRNGQAFPSIGLLAERLRCSDSSVRRAIRDLEDVSALRCRPRYVAGRQTSNDYVLAASPPFELVIEGEGVTGDRGEGVTRDRGRGSPVTPLEGEKMNDVREGLEVPPVEDDQGITSRVVGRKRNPVFDALAVACGRSLGGMTPTASREVGVASSEITAALRAEGITDADAQIEEVRARARRYRQQHPTWELTPSSLKKWWPTLGAKRPAASAAVCPECGVGGGYHQADCPFAGSSDPTSTLSA